MIHVHVYLTPFLLITIGSHAYQHLLWLLLVRILARSEAAFFCALRATSESGLPVTHFLSKSGAEVFWVTLQYFSVSILLCFLDVALVGTLVTLSEADSCVTPESPVFSISAVLSTCVTSLCLSFWVLECQGR